MNPTDCLKFFLRKRAVAPKVFWGLLPEVGALTNLPYSETLTPKQKING